ncbi:MAG: hypothetical protein K5790_10650, partial [Nitrosopumilus sp.]|uniref:LamG-like jellyroll fold domain-containing protein n=1 Tax=Nitrosopumilus sp. TaxID=2024843 RepID=UPI00247E33BC
TIPGTNSTGIPVNGTTIPGTNSTGIPVNGTTIPGTNSTGIPVNGTTIPGTNSTGIPVVVPNATASWKFDSQVNGSRFIGDVFIKETDSSLILDGNGYVSNDGNSTNDITNLSVTAWVNPNYSGGSSEFTVVSKEKSFALTINNNIAPKHIAKFAVFDGIKWHSVETTSQIGDDWSHLAATFNGTTLSIYTNGTLSNINKSIETISISLDGQLKPKTIDKITSSSDVIIGASLENHRTLDEVKKQFHGEIKEINIFDVYLNAEQIYEIYLQTLPLIESLYNKIETIEEEKIIIPIDVFAPKIVTNSTNIDLATTNSTNNNSSNATNSIIEFNDTQNYIPIIEESLNHELNELTISTWIKPDYKSGSAEFAVVSKESSFVLGINNIYSPEKIPTFAIFDGIKWTKIEGKTEIDDWSHLVAVINGTEISLYLNGNLEDKTTIPESFTILDGELSPVSAKIAENNSDLIIGAYLNTLRSKISLSNHFSGTIDDVLVYKDALSQAQINDLYARYVEPTKDSIIPFESHLLSFSDHLTVTLNNETISETILIASINSTSANPIQSFTFTDYVSYKLNNSTYDYSIDVISFSDIVEAIIIPRNSTDIDRREIQNISTTLSFTDVVHTKLNGNNLILLLESLSLDDQTDLVVNGKNNVSLSESLSFNSTIIVNHNELVSTIFTPILIPIKDSYLISEDVEFEFEFDHSSEIISDEKQRLHNTTNIIVNELEQILNDTQNTLTVNESDKTSTIIDVISEFENIFSIQTVDAAKPNDDDLIKIEIQNTKMQIKQLQEKIEQLSENERLDDVKLKEIKNHVKEIIHKINPIINKLEKNNFEQANNIKNIVKSIEDTAGIEPIQKGSWADSKKSIVIQVYDPEGNLINLDSTFEKIRDGKVSLKLLSDYHKQPGVYKIKAIYTDDGQTQIIEDEFAWGLVSLNTKKSTYKPGETAEFVIVVLDNKGHPVCDADLTMSITDPKLGISLLKSGNGITASDECGLYDSQYTIHYEGTYNVDINAMASGINTNFSTTFDASNFYEFDIIRTAQSKIDPISNPNLFNVRVGIESFTNDNEITIIETVPKVFDVQTDAIVTETNSHKILTWTKELLSNKTSIQYSYSVPLEFPQLYSLGPMEINSESMSFNEARAWFVANDPPSTLLPDSTSANPGGWTASGLACTTLHGCLQTNDAGSGIATSVTNPSSASFTVTLSDPPAPPYGNALVSFVAQKSASGGRQIDLVATLLEGATPRGTITITNLANGYSTYTFNGTNIVNFNNTSLQFSANTVGGGQGRAAHITYGSVTVSINPSPQSLNESISLTDNIHTIKAASVSLDESLAFTDAVNTIKTASVSLDESLSLTDEVNTTQAASVSLIESLTFTDTTQTSTSIPVSLLESLSVTDNVQAFPITSSTLFGDNVVCLGLGLSPGSIVPLNTSPNSCTTTASVSTTAPNDSVVNMVIFYNGTTGYSVDQKITGKSIGNDINANFAAFNGNINFTLVEMNVSPVSVNAEIDTVEITNVQEIQGNIDLSELSGIISSGKQFGIKVSMKSSNSEGDDLQIIWGKDSTANQRFMIDVIQNNVFSYDLLESFDLVDTVDVISVKQISLQESLSFTDAVESTKSASVLLAETLSMSDTAINTTGTFSISLLESLTLNDGNVLTQPIKFAESLSFSDVLIVNLSTDKQTAYSFPITTGGSCKNPNLVTADDGSSAECIDAETLQLKGFGFTVGSGGGKEIPSNALIVGIEFITEAFLNDGATAGSITDITLYNDLGNLHSTGNSTTHATFDTTAGTVHTIAGPTSLHGFEELTVAIVTDPDFGAQLTYAMTGSGNDDIAVDHVQMRVYFRIPIAYSQSLEESLTFTDEVNTSKAASVSLDESLSLTDEINTSQAQFLSLTESLSLTDEVNTSKAASVSLDESLAFVDLVDTIYAASVSLDESLTLTDEINTIKTASVFLDESLSLTDEINTIKTASVFLDESLSLTDEINTSKTASVFLDESLSLTDEINTSKTASVSLDESLTLTDEINTSKTASVSLDESLTLT